MTLSPHPVATAKTIVNAQVLTALLLNLIGLLLKCFGAETIIEIPTSSSNAGANGLFSETQALKKSKAAQIEPLSENEQLNMSREPALSR
jgi:hypothetical protein